MPVDEYYESHECPVYTQRECPQCGTMVNPDNYHDHVNSRCNKRLVECSDCEEEMTAEEYRSYHDCPAYAQRECPQCAAMVNPDNYHTHVNSKCNQRLVECSDCEEEMTAEEYRRFHDCPVYAQRECPQCGMMVNPDNYHDHVNSRCNKRLVECSDCEEEMTAEEYRSYHDCPVYAQRECPQCAAMVNPDNYDDHVNSKCNKRVVECSVCRHRMTADHLRSYHECPPTILRECPQCQAMVSRRNYSAHVSLRCSKRLVTCNDCLLRIPYDEHQRGHRCSFLCRRCGVRYRNGNEDVHDGRDCPKKVVICCNCGKSYPRDELPNHPCPIDCPLCGAHLSRPEDFGDHWEECAVMQIPCSRCHVPVAGRDRRSHVCSGQRSHISYDNFLGVNRHVTQPTLQHHVRFEPSAGDRERGGAQPAQSSKSPSPASTTVPHNGEQKEAEGKTCLVCMDAPRDTVLLPCRHMFYCSPCALRLRSSGDKCAVCRCPIRDTLTLFT